MNWSKRLVLLKISKYAIAVSLVLSIILGVYTYYGNKVGNFVINVEGGDHSITLADTDDVLNGDFSKCATTLLEDGLNDMVNCSYYNLPDDIYEGVGTKNDNSRRKYLAYGFYIINTSSVSVDYTMKIEIVEVTKNVDAAIRVLVIEGENETSSIYAKAEANEENEAHLKRNTNYKVDGYFQDRLVCLKNTNDFKESSMKKYTIAIWLEGWDKDTNNSIVGGSIRMTMTFTIL